MEYSNGNSAYTQWNKQWCIYTLISNIQGNVTRKCKILFIMFYAINIFVAY